MPFAPASHTTMPGYDLKQESISIVGTADLIIRSLLDKQQFADPHGEADRMGISSAAWPMFGLLWPSGAHLAARMALRPVTGERILEIGCGLALASLVAHRRSADITASDCHPLAAEFLEENLRLNGLPPMPYLHGHWRVPAPERAPSQQAPGCVVRCDYDLIIGSDLLYERDVNGDLAAFIGRHGAPSCEVWIVDPDRGNRPAFTRHMAAQGFTMRQESLDHPVRPDAPLYKGRMLIYTRAARPVCQQNPDATR